MLKIFFSRSASIVLVLLLLPILSLAQEGNDVWGVRLVKNDGNGVTIEFKYRFESKSSKDVNVLAYAVPRFEGMEWSLWRMKPGTGAARIDINCREGCPPNGRTEKIFVYMNEHGKVLFSKEIDFPIRWNCARGATGKESSDKQGPSFQVSVKNVQLDDTTANTLGVEFPVDHVTVAIALRNIGDVDFSKPDLLVVRVEALNGGYSANGSLQKQGIVYQISRLGVGEEISFKFRDAFYHPADRSYRVYISPADGLTGRRLSSVKDWINTMNGDYKINYRIDDNKLHRNLSRR